MGKNNAKIKWWIAGAVILAVAILIFAIVKLKQNSENNDKIIYSEEQVAALILGEENNAETLEKLHNLWEKEPALKKLPLNVEFYSEDKSEYTKYTLSYAMDDSERGFYLIMKDYTGAGMIAAIAKMQELGMDPVGVELRYENWASDSLSGHAE